MAVLKQARAGEFRHVVQVYSPARVEQPSGEKKVSYSLTKTTRGKVEKLKGAELIHAAQTQASSTIKITMRYVSGLTTEDRLTVDSVNYGIDSINDIMERNRVTECICTRMS